MKEKNKSKIYSDYEEEEDNNSISARPVNVRKDKLIFMTPKLERVDWTAPQAWKQLVAPEVVAQIKKQEEEYQKRLKMGRNYKMEQTVEDNENEVCRDYRYKITEGVARFALPVVRSQEDKIEIVKFKEKSLEVEQEDVVGSDELVQALDVLDKQYEEFGSARAILGIQSWFTYADVVEWYKLTIQKVIRQVIKKGVMTSDGIMMRICRIRACKNVVRAVYKTMKRVYSGKREKEAFNQWSVWWRESEEMLIYGLNNGMKAMVWKYGMPEYHRMLIWDMYRMGYISYNFEWLGDSLHMCYRDLEEIRIVSDNLHRDRVSFGVRGHDIWRAILRGVEPLEYRKMMVVSKSFYDVISYYIADRMERCKRGKYEGVYAHCKHWLYEEYNVVEQKCVCGLRRDLLNVKVEEDDIVELRDKYKVNNINLVEQYWIIQHLKCLDSVDRDKFIRVMKQVRRYWGGITFRMLTYVMSTFRKLSDEMIVQAQLFLPEASARFLYGKDQMLGTEMNRRDFNRIVQENDLLGQRDNVRENFRLWLKSN